MSKSVLFKFNQVDKNFTLPQGEVTVLNQLDFSAYAGEFIVIVGPSGAGKSTLLRLISGLIRPSKGSLIYKDHPLDGVNPDAAFVFQNFALLPWLTVFENVVIGLEARNIDKSVREKKASFYINKVGLDGYEEAYPRELSGGMKQRVGLARALVIEPEVLVMDEPFSSLDILTAINMRDELIDIWKDPDIPVNTIVMVTHMIEEAIELADRVLVLTSRPGRIAGDLSISLQRPRDKQAPEFIKLVDQVFSLLT